jgi:hypothetical protein
MEKTKAADGWSRLLGYAWTEMLRRQRLSPAGTVVEIGPGFTDKLARGLAMLDFYGTVILVEPNEAAGAWAFQRYRRLLPQAEVLVMQRPIPDGKITQRLSVDILLSNHILDDLILNAALLPEISARIFSHMQPGAPCSRMFIRKWQELLALPKLLEQIIAQVAGDFTNYVEEMQPRLVLLNQYPSWRHNLHDLGSIHTQALRLMNLMETSLGAVCVDSTAFLGSDYQTPMRWLIGEPKRNTAGCCVEAQKRVNERDFRI